MKGASTLNRYTCIRAKDKDKTWSHEKTDMYKDSFRIWRTIHLITILTGVLLWEDHFLFPNESWSRTFQKTSFTMRRETTIWGEIDPLLYPLQYGSSNVRRIEDIRYHCKRFLWKCQCWWWCKDFDFLNMCIGFSDIKSWIWFRGYVERVRRSDVVVSKRIRDLSIRICIWKDYYLND